MSFEVQKSLFIVVGKSRKKLQICNLLIWISRLVWDCFRAKKVTLKILKLCAKNI